MVHSFTTAEYITGMSVYYLMFILLAGLVLARLAEYIDDRFIITVSGTLLLLIAGLRMPGTDKDSLSYILSFSTFKSPLDYFIHNDEWFFYEPFYYLIPATAKFYFGHEIYPHIVFAVFALISVPLKLSGINKLSSLKGLSILHFYCYFFLLHEMTQIRAGVVCGLFLMAIYFFCNKMYWYYAFMIVIGLQFHNTAILMLSLVVLSPEKFNTRVYLVAGAVVMTTAFLFSDLIIGLLFRFNFSFVQKLAWEFANVNADEDQINLLNVGFLLNVAFTIWLLINHKRIQEQNRYGYILLKLQAISIIAFVAFSSVNMVAYRVSEFFGIVSIITVPMVVYTFRSRLVGYTITFVYSFLILVLNLQYAELMKPYQLFFLGFH